MKALPNNHGSKALKQIRSCCNVPGRSYTFCILILREDARFVRVVWFSDDRILGTQKETAVVNYDDLQSWTML